jgi:hypothetical protein
VELPSGRGAPAVSPFGRVAIWVPNQSEGSGSSPLAGGEVASSRHWYAGLHKVGGCGTGLVGTPLYRESIRTGGGLLCGRNCLAFTMRVVCAWDARAMPVPCVCQAHAMRVPGAHHARTGRPRSSPMTWALSCKWLGSGQRLASNHAPQGYPSDAFLAGPGRKCRPRASNLSFHPQHQDQSSSIACPLRPGRANGEDWPLSGTILRGLRPVWQRVPPYLTSAALACRR